VSNVTPRTPRKRLTGEERRAAILDSALSVFADRGYHASAIDDIAREAGISKALIYEHFPSKRDLFRALLDTYVGELMERETVSQADMGRICARVEKRPPMAPYNLNGRRRRPAIGANGADAAALPASPGQGEHPGSVPVGKAFGGTSSGDGDH